jgi:hypothetical protein
MNQEDLKLVKAKDIKAGYLYLDKYNKYTLYMCIGKCIARKGYYYAFEVLKCDYIYAYSIEEVFNRIMKSRKYRFEGVHILPDFEDEKAVFDLAFYELGKFIEPEKINARIAQLKMCGLIKKERNVDFYIDEVYIGDWRKRNKLPCVTKFEKGKYYMREPLYALKKQTGLLLGESPIWRYGGSEIRYYRKIHIWYEFEYSKLFLVSRGLLEQCKVHYIQNQYTDMVEFNQNEWKGRV